MPFSYDPKIKRFRDSKGRMVSKTRGLKSSIARKEFIEFNKVVSELVDVQPEKRFPLKKVGVKPFPKAKSVHTSYETIDKESIRTFLKRHRKKEDRFLVIGIIYEGIHLSTGNKVDGELNSSIKGFGEAFENLDIIIQSLFERIAPSVKITSITYFIRVIKFTE